MLSSTLSAFRRLPGAAACCNRRQTEALPAACSSASEKLTGAVLSLEEGSVLVLSCDLLDTLRFFVPTALKALLSQLWAAPPGRAVPAAAEAAVRALTAGGRARTGRYRASVGPNRARLGAAFGAGGPQRGWLT